MVKKFIMHGAVCFSLLIIILLALMALAGNSIAKSRKLSGENSRAQAAENSAVLKALSGILKEERIEPIPFPHLEGTAPFTLPKRFPPRWSCPKCMPENDHRPVVAWQYWQAEHYFIDQIAKTPVVRDRAWHNVNFSSVASYEASVSKHRKDLREMLGLVELKPTEIDRVVAEKDTVRVEDVTIWLQHDFSAKALVFSPTGGTVRGAVIAIPDANQNPQDFAGILEGETPSSWLETLLERDIAVAVPLMVERSDDSPLCKKLGNYGSPKDERHILELLGFIVGRTMTGLDVQQVMTVRDYLTTWMSIKGNRVGLLGIGQGGMTALYAAAADPHFLGACVVDYFQQREDSWEEPIDRMLYGQLNEFGDAEVAALVAPRPLDVIYTPGGPSPASSVHAEEARAHRFYAGLNHADELTVSQETKDRALQAAAEKIATRLGREQASRAIKITARISKKGAEEANRDHFDQLHSYLCRLDAESDQVRAKRWQLLSTAPEERSRRAEQLRKELAKLMGVIPDDGTPLNPRTKLIQVTDRYMAYDVLLGVIHGVDAYGQLLIPRHSESRMPVVICQHGYGGAPLDITGTALWPWETSEVYWEFGRALANRGYVVFAPYVTTPLAVGEVSNRNLVRLAATLGMMRTSLEEKKLHKIVDFLQSLPVVDPGRIGYYGLSYGGYDSTWMPPLEPRLRFTVISGHFNDWRAKITNEDYPTSYLLHPDLDFHNWDVLDRFTHVELIASIYPRPVCVEFAEHDGTTTPEWHRRAWDQVMAYAKVWGITDDIVQSHFDGIHEIHGVGTLDFIDRWLRPEQASGRGYVYHDWSKTTCRGCRTPVAAEVQRLQDQDDTPHLYRSETADFPYLAHALDASKETLVRGRFRVGTDSPVFTGMAIRASRVGHPGDLIIKFGTQAGDADIGAARIPAGRVDPTFDLWWEGHVSPVRLIPGKEYYFELSAASGSIADDNYYVVYGPKPLGGLDYPPDFPVAYQVLTQAQPHLSPPYQRFKFAKAYMAGYNGGPFVIQVGSNFERGDVRLTPQWSIHAESSDEVVSTAAKDLHNFFQNALGINVNLSSPGPAIQLRVLPGGVEGVSTQEGFRAEVSPDLIRIAALTPRGVMRGVYWLEDEFRLEHRPSLKAGVTIRNCRLARRITTAVVPGGDKYTETSHPLVYTDGLLQRISHSGFNSIWVWVSTEELTLHSKVFPELNDPYAMVRLNRLEDVARRARRYGIDVYVYLSTGYNHHLPESFFEKHPNARGYGWGPPMCTSNPQVRQYYSGVVEGLFHHAPDVKGLVVIYDSEGFWYCGNCERSLKKCPRCSHFTQQEVAAQLLITLDKAMHAAGGPSKELIAWNYNVASQWVVRMFSLLPKDIIIQADFDKGMDVVKDGIKNHTEDYNISNVGPPDLFIAEYKAARAQGLRVMAKTEHAVSQEFIFVPYIPCMEQWYRRIAKIREYDLGGFFANWDHYGYTPSRPALLINRMAFDPAPLQGELLRELALRDFGPAATPFALRAWHDYSEGILEYPYSDAVARYPGPIQKGPSNPFFIDPSIKNFGKSRSWQNDFKWTKPWGPEITSKYLQQVEDWFEKGNSELEAALKGTPQGYDAEIEGELRIGQTLATSVRSDLNLIKWLEARAAYYSSNSLASRKAALNKMETVALAERSNAQQILPDLDADTRLGYASEGGGVTRGGLFDPDLVRWKIGEIEDLLLMRLSALGAAVPGERSSK
jgi:cephalosporin-C deacetylase-like acetyl esterase